MNFGKIGVRGGVRVVVYKIEEAKRVLEAAKFHRTKRSILCLEWLNSRASLGKFADEIAAEGMDVSEGYATKRKWPSRRASSTFLRNWRKQLAFVEQTQLSCDPDCAACSVP
ncbi:MAG TPA: hypothetical protein VE398_18570 [Acidobacteriota bacterium]|nr:hypothetical protein [Acidobacteriota bacterium]